MTRRFFIPNLDFMSWVKDNFQFKTIVDCGARGGELSEDLRKSQGLRNVLSIDLFPQDPSVIQADAVTFDYPKNSVLFFCRPCHSSLVEETLKEVRRKFSEEKLSIDAVYVGFEKNVQEDLGEFFPFFSKRDFVAGSEGEQVWRWKEGNHLKTFLKVQDTYYPNMKPSWYLQSFGYLGSKEFSLVNPSGGTQPFKETIHQVLDSREARTFEELDWSGTYLDDAGGRLHPRTGWLSPEGEFWGCRSTEHDSVAYFLFKVEIEKLEKIGWVRVQHGSVWVKENSHLTECQKKFILEKGFQKEHED